MAKEKESPVTVATNESKHEKPVIVKKNEVDQENPTKLAKPLTMAYLNSELESLKQTVLEQGQQIAGLQEAMSRKRRPVVSNGKVQIRDKQTSKW
jgi:hypothetical protein